MKAEFNKEHTRFRDEVCAFLDENLTPEMRRAEKLCIETFAEFEVGRQWLARLAERGWGQPGWPVEYGGTDWTVVQHYIFKRETTLAGAPRGFNNHPGACIIKYGTEEQKQRFLPPIRNVEEIWAQGYSEPQAGSDLASLKTSAVADGEDYVVNGSKIWTTFAHHADWLFCLVRTSTEGRKQQGITFLLIDLSTPGIEIRPILNIAGQHDFNQVFFNDVRVPKANRLGEENEGWTVAKHFLAFEHMGGGAARLQQRLDALANISNLEHTGRGARLADDPGVQAALADIGVQIQALDMFELRLLSAMSRGDAPGAEGSMAKLRGASIMQQITLLGTQCMAYYGLPYQPELLAVASNEPSIVAEHGNTETLRYLMKRGETIYGGADEVQHDILAKRTLGL